MTAPLLILIVMLPICSYLLFAALTETRFYSSALVTLFIFNYKKWRLYKKAKKQGVRTYLYPADFEIDADMGDIPEFYLYPLVQEDGGIHYYLYTDNYTFITDNFQLTSRL